jgi:hypothetical protein cdiviTM7_02704
LMVFIALPALQASQRDTARKSDVSIVSAAYNSAVGSNRGTTSVDSGVLRRFVNGVSDNTDITKIEVRRYTETVTVGDASIIVISEAKCDASQPEGVQKLSKGTRRQYVTITKLESGNNAAYCLDA